MFILALQLLALLPAPSATIPDVTFQEIPFNTPRTYNPDRVAAGPSGSIWFLDSTFHQIGSVTLDGSITTFPLKPAGADYADGNRLTMGPDGNMWFTAELKFGNTSQPSIGKCTPTGTITYFPIPSATDALGQPTCADRDGIVNDCDITAGPDGNVWFAETRNGKVGRVTPAGVITEFPLSITGGTLNHITAGPDGNLWLTRSFSRIIRVTPGGSSTVFRIATDSDAAGIAAGPDGNVWYAATNNRIGRVTPAGVITEFPVPTAGSFPISIAAGPDGQMWFTEAGGKKIGRLTITGLTPTVSAPPGTIEESPIPSPLTPNDIVRIGGRMVFTAYELTSNGIDFRLFRAESVTSQPCDMGLNIDLKSDPFAGESFSKGVSIFNATCPCQLGVLGQLPPGLAISPSGTSSFAISGKPTTPGLYEFSLVATDSKGCTTTKPSQIRVLPSRGVDLEVVKEVLTINGFSFEGKPFPRLSDDDVIIFRIQVKNRTGAIVPDATFTLTDEMPENLRLIDVTDSHDIDSTRCFDNKKVATCTGDSAGGTYFVRTQVAGLGDVTNTAVLTCEKDFNSANNHSTVIIVPPRRRAVGHR